MKGERDQRQTGHVCYKLVAQGVEQFPKPWAIQAVEYLAQTEKKNGKDHCVTVRVQGTSYEVQSYM